jgi:hypothetical protein
MKIEFDLDKAKANLLRDEENIKIPELRRIGLRIQGAHSRLRNPWRNTEHGAINKQGCYFNIFLVPQT